MHETNLRILRGEMTIDEAVDLGLVTRTQVYDWQERHIARLLGKPWERYLETLWTVAVRGWRKFVVVPLFILFLALPFVQSQVESGVKLWSAAKDLLTGGRAGEMTPGEADSCNEWVARVSWHQSRDDAREDQKALVTVFEREDRKYRDDVFVVRDIERNGFLLVVDIGEGPSTREALSRELGQMTAKNPQGLGNNLAGAQPFYYRRSAFERLYGKGSATKCHFPEVP